jgi:hypothetical protein
LGGYRLGKALIATGARKFSVCAVAPAEGGVKYWPDRGRNSRLSGRSPLRTVRADLPHTALQLVVHPRIPQNSGYTILNSLWEFLLVRVSAYAILCRDRGRSRVISSRQRESSDRSKNSTEPFLLHFRRCLPLRGIMSRVTFILATTGNFKGSHSASFRNVASVISTCYRDRFTPQVSSSRTGHQELANSTYV